jgi:hypothetical protein
MGTISSVTLTPHSRARPQSGIVDRYALVAATGVVLLLAQVACTFFARPIFVGFDILAFGFAGALFTYRKSRPWWVNAAFVAGPAFVFTTFVVVVALGPEQLSRGIGSNWVLSLALVPFSAVAGAYVAQRGAGPRKR